MATMPPTNDFVMHGARDAVSGGLTHIVRQVKGIERAVVENPGLAFDLAKTVAESACRTILSDGKVAFGSDDDLPRLFKIITTNLPVLPVAASSEVVARKTIVQTLNGLPTALQGVCELRNADGFASHGADRHRPVMESVQAILAAQAADAIVEFLHRLHRQERGTSPIVRLGYNDNEAFNTYLDEANEQVRVASLVYRPSEVLFAVDQEAYRDLLAGFALVDIDAADNVATATARSAP